MQAGAWTTNERGAEAEAPADRHRFHRGGRRPGFTLIELVIVVTMLGIIGSMAIPRIDFDRYRSEAAARSTRALLQSAQRTAILRQTDVIVRFDASQNVITVVEDANNNNQIDNGERVVSRALPDGAHFATPPTALSGCGSTAVSGSHLLTVNTLPAVSFLRDGAASSDLCVYITDGHAGPRTIRAIRLTQATGRTEYWFFDGAQWREAGA